MKLLFLFAAFFTASPAQAYLPPAFFVYQQITAPRAKAVKPAVLLSVSRPLTSGTEEVLGTIAISSWEPAAGGWPTLSLIFAPTAEELMAAVEKFGPTTTPEQGLLRAPKEAAAAMKEPPRPFYRRDKTMSLKRFRQVFAWVHSDTDRSHSIWIGKDSLYPLKIEGPCPAEVQSLSWAKAGSGKCELEFRNPGSLKKGNFQNSKLVLSSEGSPILYFTFEKVVTKTGAGETKIAENLQAISSILFH